MEREIGVGLVGYGGIGRMHALCYQMLPLAYPDLPITARVVAVATASAASAERARRELGPIATTIDFVDLIEHPDVAMVDCCAPTGDHAAVARAALLAGKPLFCEKPLAATAEEAEQIATLARDRQIPGGMNFHFRRIPAIEEARRRIDDGMLGEIYGFHMRYYRASNLKRDRPVSWRFSGPGSGVLADLGSHLIDLTLHLLGPIKAVSAQTRTVIPTRPGVEGALARVDSDDVAWLQLELADRGRGTLEASKVVPGAADDLRVEAYGSEGTLLFDTRNPNLLHIGNANGGVQSVATLSRTQPSASLPGAETPTGVIQWHLASIAAFLIALGAGTRPRPDLDDGAQVDRVIAAALQSVSENGTLIQL